MSQHVFELLKSRIKTPLTLIDVGAAGGAIEGWRLFGDKARVFCFEAREDESAALSSTNAQSNIEYVPIALSHDDNGIELTITSNLGCSSVYPPIPKLHERYPGCAMMRPERNVSCASTTLDAFLDKRGIGTVHAIKLDTQGSELNILRGAEAALRTCQFVMVEAEFNPLYQGQPLFCDLDRYLRDRGFVLWRFNNLAHYSTGRLGGEPHAMLIGTDPGGHYNVAFANGQLFWGDALYVKEAATSTSDAPLSFAEAIAGAALVSQWRFWDLAVEMIRKSGDADLLTQTLALLDSSFTVDAKDRFFVSEFRSEALSVRGPFLETDFSVTDACILYGPYVRLPYGEHEVTFHVQALGLADQSLASGIVFDVAQDMTRLAAVELSGEPGRESLRAGKIAVRFFNSAAKALFEFRIFTAGRPYQGALVFYGASLRQM